MTRKYVGNSLDLPVSQPRVRVGRDLLCHIVCCQERVTAIKVKIERRWCTCESADDFFRESGSRFDFDPM